VIVGANQLINPSFSEKLGIDLSTAGLITTIWGVGCVAGALVGGVVLDKAGGRAALWLSLVSVLATLVFIALVPSLGLAYAAVVLFGLAYGASQAIYFAMAMKYTRPDIAASMYSILMAVTNVGQGIGLGVGGLLAKSMGFMPTFLLFGAAMFLILPFFPIIFRRSK
jgi:predicted MFS family arabinose efflux permease